MATLNNQYAYSHTVSHSCGLWEVGCGQVKSTWGTVTSCCCRWCCWAAAAFGHPTSWTDGETPQTSTVQGMLQQEITRNNKKYPAHPCPRTSCRWLEASVAHQAADVWCAHRSTSDSLIQLMCAHGWFACLGFHGFACTADHVWKTGHVLELLLRVLFRNECCWNTDWWFTNQLQLIKKEKACNIAI